MPPDSPGGARRPGRRCLLSHAKRICVTLRADGTAGCWWGSWCCGTSPQGLFRSDDGGHSWRPIDGLHGHADFDTWTSLEADHTPDGPKLHSILIDPRDPDRLLVGLSCRGVLTSDDAGASWERLDGGLAGLEASDPHCAVSAATNSDLLWMQTHHGVYRMEREDETWIRCGPRDSDGGYADAGFPIAVHPHDPDIAWVVPMDGTERWTRMPVDGRPADTDALRVNVRVVAM